MRPSPRLLRNPLHLLALGFGSGLAPVAPGTFGTLVAVPFYYLLVHAGAAVYFSVLCAATLFGIGICGYTARALGVHDHPAIVWDEVVGYLITMAWAPTAWYWMAMGFVLFRLFDILKPWPVRWADRRVHGGLGIMLDDILAGVMAWLVLQGAVRLLS